MNSKERSKEKEKKSFKRNAKGREKRKKRVKEMKEIILISTFRVKDSCHQDTHQDKIIKRSISSSSTLPYHIVGNSR